MLTRQPGVAGRPDFMVAPARATNQSRKAALALGVRPRNHGVMFEVGPYRFTLTDARKTLDHAFDLLDQYPESVHQHQTERRDRLGGLLSGADPLGARPDQVGALLEVVWPELLDGREDLVTAGRVPSQSIGAVSSLNRSAGGLPKTPVDRVEIGHGGVIGDAQATRVHHGRPWQALCLWSAEVIGAFVADGHHLFPGAAGENLTVTGLPWADVYPGVRLRAGGMLCQVSAYALPCRQNARWFSDGDFSRLHFSQGPVSRVYATVLEPGHVSSDDEVVIEP